MNDSLDAKSASASGKGAEYAKKKLPKIQMEVDTKLAEYKFEFELEDTRQVSAELLDGLNVLVKILK